MLACSNMFTGSGIHNGGGAFPSGVSHGGSITRLLDTDPPVADPVLSCQQLFWPTPSQTKSSPLGFPFAASVGAYIRLAMKRLPLDMNGWAAGSLVGPTTIPCPLASQTPYR